MTATKNGNVVPEEEFRSRILCAIRQLMVDRRPITFTAMKEAGMRGDSARFRKGIETLRQEGLIPAHVLPCASGHAPPDDIDLMAAKDLERQQRIVAHRETEAREQSAEWVAAHDAIMRRIRRKAKGETMRAESA